MITTDSKPAVAARELMQRLEAAQEQFDGHEFWRVSDKLYSALDVLVSGPTMTVHGRVLDMGIEQDLVDRALAEWLVAAPPQEILDAKPLITAALALADSEKVWR